VKELPLIIRGNPLWLLRNKIKIGFFEKIGFLMWYLDPKN
jgi:hypothetical protein